MGLCVGRHEVGVGVEPEAMEAERADSAPGLSFAIGGLDVFYRTCYLGSHMPGAVVRERGAGGSGLPDHESKWEIPDKNEYVLLPCYTRR